MAATMTAPHRSDPVRSLDDIRPSMAKAVRPSDRAFCSVMREAIVAHYGSVKEAAFALGQVDESLMRRELEAGKFGRFDEHADDAAKGAVTQALLRAFPPCDPRAEAMRLIREARARLDALAEVI